MNVKETILAIDACFLAGLTPHLIGKHGIGKSSVVYQYAASHDYDVVEVRLGLMADAGDLVGIQEFVRCKKTGEPMSTRHVLPEWFMKAVAQIESSAQKRRKVIIFLDEVNRGHKDVMQAIFELIYDHSLKGVKMEEGCQVIAASNPPTKDYSTMDFKDAAFQDRLAHIMFEPTVEEWLSFMRTEAPESSVADFIANYPKMLEDDELESYTLKEFVKPSRRSWDRVTKLEKVGVDPLIEKELLFGIVGEIAAISYTSFRESNGLKSIKATEALNDYQNVRKQVLNLVSKNRTDMLGTLVEDLDKVIKELPGLTMQQADNLAELAHDLPVELAYTLGITVKSNSTVTMKISDIDPNKMIHINDKGETVPYATLGMFAHTKFVDRVKVIQGKRRELQNQQQSANP